MADAKESPERSQPHAASAPSLSMRMVTFGIRKKFPSVRHIDSEQLEQWRVDRQRKLICLVRYRLNNELNFGKKLCRRFD